MALAGDGSSAFSRALASNSRKQRDAALFALTQWLGARTSVEESDLMKIWKGQFYAMWHADKAPVQVCAHVTSAGGTGRCLLRSAAHTGGRCVPKPPPSLRPVLHRQAEVAESMAAVLDACQPEVGHLPFGCSCACAHALGGVHSPELEEGSLPTAAFPPGLTAALTCPRWRWPTWKPVSSHSGASRLLPHSTRHTACRAAAAPPLVVL